jgi:hypothetical protein
MTAFRDPVCDTFVGYLWRVQSHVNEAERATFLDYDFDEPFVFVRAQNCFYADRSATEQDK